MVNSTILESIQLNNSIVQKGISFLTTTAQDSSQKINTFISSNVPQVWMANILLLIVACGVIFLASKLTQKIAKIGLYILGAILAIGTLMNFFV